MVDRMRYPELPSALVDRSGYDKGRYQILRNRLLALLGGVCVRCGTDQNLEFDHRDPKSKKFTIMAKWNNYTNEELYKEIEKCQLLCKKHHIEKTREDIGVPHGGGVSGKREGVGVGVTYVKLSTTNT